MSTTPTTIQTVSITLSHHIKPHQVNRWRGAFLQMIGWDNELFHNHDNNTSTNPTASPTNVHYRYPLIQYYEQKGVGKILGINQGRDALLDIIGDDKKELKIKWNNRWMDLKVLSVHPATHTFQMLREQKKYRLHNWLALNTKNYRRWLDCQNLVQRIELLDKLLANNIIGLFKELKYDWPIRLEANLQMIHRANAIQYKKTPLFAFDVDFTTNADLPTGIAIGNKVSHGYGWIEVLDTNTHRRTPIIR